MQGHKGEAMSDLIEGAISAQERRKIIADISSFSASCEGPKYNGFTMGNPPIMEHEKYGLLWLHFGPDGRCNDFTILARRAKQ